MFADAAIPPIAPSGFDDEKLRRTFALKLVCLELRAVDFRSSAKAERELLIVHRLSASCPIRPCPPPADPALRSEQRCTARLLCEPQTALSTIAAPNWQPLLVRTHGIAWATSVDQAVVAVVYLVTRRRAAVQLVHPLWRHATPDLQSANGRLNAKKIAQLFGVSQTDLAKMLEVKLQTLNKTPDAESLQSRLRNYPRIARLRMLPDFSDADFGKSLRSPAPAFNGRAPFNLLKEKKSRLVAGLVENMLTGQPA